MRLIVLLAGWLSVTACVSPSGLPVDVDALAEYRVLVESLRAESSSALSREYDLAYASFIERMQSSAGADPRPFRLTFPPDAPFGWQVGENPSDQAEFLAIATVRSQLDGLHQVVLEYLNVLMQLNVANVPAQERVAASTEKLSGSVTSLSSKLGFELNEGQIGVFSMAGKQLAQFIIDKKQRAGLSAVMSDFQPGLVKFSDHAAFAIAVSASGIKENYQNKVQPIAQKIVEAEPEGREALLDQLLELNQRTIEQLEILRELALAYGALPGGHAELMSALERGGVARLTSLVASLEAIATWNEKLKAASE